METGFSSLGKLLVGLGLLLLVVGLVFLLANRFSDLGLGRLPGDIRIKGDNFSFYIPITTCVLVSLVLTAILWLISYFLRR